MDHLRFFDGIEHLLAFLDIHGEGLFAEDVLAGFGGGDGDLGMDVVRRHDIDDVDIRIIDHGAPVGGAILPAKLFCGSGDLVGKSVDGIEVKLGL